MRAGGAKRKALTGADSKKAATKPRVGAGALLSVKTRETATLTVNDLHYALCM